MVACTAEVAHRCRLGASLLVYGDTVDRSKSGHNCTLIYMALPPLLEEGEEIAADFKGSPAINAALICAAQKVEHYEIASYVCLHQWAGLLENEEATHILGEILADEKAADETLTGLAASLNQEALGEAAGDRKEARDETTTFAERGVRATASKK